MVFKINRCLCFKMYNSFTKMVYEYSLCPRCLKFLFTMKSLYEVLEAVVQSSRPAFHEHRLGVAGEGVGTYSHVFPL